MSDGKGLLTDPRCGSLERQLLRVAPNALTGGKGPGASVRSRRAFRSATSGSCASPPSERRAAKDRRQPLAAGRTGRVKTLGALAECGKRYKRLRHRSRRRDVRLWHKAANLVVYLLRLGRRQSCQDKR